MKKIGIIGRGFVGSAVEFGFSAQTGCDAEVRIYDKNPTKSTHTLEETVNKSDFIFLSVPTPSNPDGSMHLGILESALQDIQNVNKRKDNIILIILGGRKRNTGRVAELFRWRFGDSIPCIETNFNTAEMIKYMNNCFFATKVSFMNEMRTIADKCGVDWDMAVEGFVRDGRIGHTHLNVPGPDGKFGFGGSCFPKDVQAMIDFGKTLGLHLHTLEGVWNTNLKVRPERDWEKLEGRAIIKDTTDDYRRSVVAESNDPFNEMF
jgi:UDPglucose 6-dehydrogenase